MKITAAKPRSPNDTCHECRRKCVGREIMVDVVVASFSFLLCTYCQGDLVDRLQHPAGFDKIRRQG